MYKLIDAEKKLGGSLLSYLHFPIWFNKKSYYNSFDLEKCYNSRNKTSISMLLTYYIQYQGLKPKDSEELIKNTL